MGTIGGNFYRVKYQILQSSADSTGGSPQTAVATALQDPQDALVNAATQIAAVTALTADLSLSGSQRLRIVSIKQENPGPTVYN